MPTGMEPIDRYQVRSFTAESSKRRGETNEQTLEKENGRKISRNDTCRSRIEVSQMPLKENGEDFNKGNKKERKKT